MIRITSVLEQEHKMVSHCVDCKDVCEIAFTLVSLTQGVKKVEKATLTIVRNSPMIEIAFWKTEDLKMSTDFANAAKIAAWPLAQGKRKWAPEVTLRTSKGV